MNAFEVIGYLLVVVGALTAAAPHIGWLSGPVLSYFCREKATDGLKRDCEDSWRRGISLVFGVVLLGGVALALLGRSA